MAYDQTYTMGKSIIHIVGPGNPTKDKVEAILDECHSIAREILKETAESVKEKAKEP